MLEVVWSVFSLPSSLPLIFIASETFQGSQLIKYSENCKKKYMKAVTFSHYTIYCADSEAQIDTREGVESGEKVEIKIKTLMSRVF